MEIIDAQVHTWLAERPILKWHPDYRKMYPDTKHLQHAGQSMGPEALLIEMAEAGVDNAVLVPVGVYGTDNTFELNAARRFPRRFAVVGTVDHLAPGVADRLERDVSNGMLGVRIGSLGDADRLARGEFDTALGACQNLGLSVSFMLVHPMAEALPQLLRRYDGIDFLIDHVGVGIAPPVYGAPTDDAFANLDVICHLAKMPNVSLKLTGAPSLSRERYPFADTWQPILKLIDTFGVERVMWGSDFTRTNALYSYWEGVDYLRQIPGLSDSDRRQLYGHTLRRVIGWKDPDA